MFLHNPPDKQAHRRLQHNIRRNQRDMKTMRVTQMKRRVDMIYICLKCPRSLVQTSTIRTTDSKKVKVKTLPGIEDVTESDVCHVDLVQTTSEKPKKQKNFFLIKSSSAGFIDQVVFRFLSSGKRGPPAHPARGRLPFTRRLPTPDPHQQPPQDPLPPPLPQAPGGDPGPVFHA